MTLTPFERCAKISHDLQQFLWVFVFQGWEFHLGLNEIEIETLVSSIHL